MSDLNRRDFLHHVPTGLAAGAIGQWAVASARAAGANDRLRIALIGCGGRGTHDAKLFVSNPGVEIAWVCDADTRRLAAAAETFDIPADHAVSDLRTVLDDQKLDAVLVATPNHWHAPASILACDAGKHVYVEKPCSHNIREGRLLVDSARRNNRVVQHGTQSRSTSTTQLAVQMLKEGIIGDVYAAKTWNIQRRGSIGHAQPTDPPSGFDYDLWVGPATMKPFQPNCHHSTWNWFYHFGCGDFGNDGVHDIDYAMWGLGVDTHPTNIVALGGKYAFDDDQEFPDTQQVTFEYPGDGKPGSRKMLIYEQRLWSTNYPQNCDSGVEYYGTKGQLFTSRRGKLQVLGERNARIDVDVPLRGQDDAAHVTNFIDCIRNGGTPNAEIEIGHLSTSLCHLGNIAVRVGRALKFDPQTEQFLGDDEANKLVTREYREHWGTPKGA
ncbi:MAG: Gfo/Idh/MocA family oxidoreductase [Planctomycetota bacterium]|nr:Gfo/Idh/MocA family oxidoreductase [Planctomycetota bacterium]MDA1211809.1 Gfo/Idh/MocA family oxidoreductase [Planctomycetota bacterium]